MTPDGPALACRELVVRYGRAAPALDGLSLSIGRGQVHGLLGPNGAGKSTLIKAALGLCRPRSGEVSLLGEPAGRAEARRQVGYLPEHLQLPGHLSGRAALDHCAMLHGLDPRPLAARALALLERLGLAKHAHRAIRGYSKGMRQRLGVAQAVLHEPELLILDEPTDGIDPIGRELVGELIDEEARRGATVIVSSHLLTEVQDRCATVSIIDRGRLVGHGTVQELAGAVPTVARYALELDRAPSTEDRAAFAPLAALVWDGRRAAATVPEPAAIRALALAVWARGYELRALVLAGPNLADVYRTLVGGGDGA